MGCCGAKSTYGIDPEEIEGQVRNLRQRHGSDVLVMGIKDQNVPGKLCLAGGKAVVTEGLVKDIEACLKSDENNQNIIVESDKYDMMWSHCWHKTSLTTGHSTFSLQKSYFPRGKIIVKLLDTIAKHGWDLCAAPNFGGVASRDDKGNVTSTVDFPVFIFYRSPQESEFSNEHMLLAVKDSNIPGKLCAAGPIGGLEAKMTAALAPFAKDVKSEKDSYDDDFDVVWRNTSITTGMNALSFGKAYFPKGKTNIAVLEAAYSEGWRCVAAPNFGGYGDSWPSYVLRKLKVPSNSVPELLFASIKDSNLPGKLCQSGKSADGVTTAVCGVLTTVPDNDKAHSEKDGYDDDHDAVVRDCKITTGMQAFSLRAKYFPRGDAMIATLNAWQQEGFQVVSCPNFGGMKDSWPTFVLEKKESVPPQMFLGVKDENIPGKVALIGGGISSDSTLSGELMDVFQTLCGPDVVQQKDDYDQSYELAFRNTRLTTGHATFTWQKPYWPHGCVIELMLQVLLKHGFKAQGGPNFGDDGNTWPGLIFSKDA